MDITWTQGLLSLGVGVGLAAAAGLRVFLPLLALSLAARFEWLPLTSGFEWLSSNSAMLALAAATALEIGAYYVPVLDNLLDALAGPLAVVAGIIAATAVMGNLPPVLRWSVGIVAGGGTAGIVQSLTTLARLKSTAFTGGFGNFAIATFELVGSLVTSVIAILAPVIALIVVVGIICTLLVAKRASSGRSRQQPN